jgi:hypothetical protein
MERAASLCLRLSGLGGMSGQLGVAGRLHDFDNEGTVRLVQNKRIDTIHHVEKCSANNIDASRSLNSNLHHLPFKHGHKWIMMGSYEGFSRIQKKYYQALAINRVKKYIFTSLIDSCPAECRFPPPEEIPNLSIRR